MINKTFSLKKLEWESNACGFDVSEITFYNNINSIDLGDVFNNINKDRLIIIKNPTRYRSNSKVISEYTNATIYDTNVLFIREIKPIASHEYNYSYDEKIVMCSDFSGSIKRLLHFSESRFHKDKKLYGLVGKKLYNDWVESSKNTKKKFLFLLNESRRIGFILFRIERKSIIIELISVDAEYQKQSVGSKLINYLHSYGSTKQLKRIYVGTQVSNIAAMNFYIKNHFSVAKTVDIYHWWRYLEKEE